MEETFDCIIVGGGIAGLSAALTLARADARFLLIERGEFAGAKNVSGGVLWGHDLVELVPEYWTDDDAGFERVVNHRRLTFMDEGSSFSLDFKSDHFDGPPYAGITVLRARFDRWLADRVDSAIAESAHPYDSFIATGVRVDEVIEEDGRAVGIRAGEERFFADCIILAEGVNNLLTRQVGLQDDYVPADHVAVGVKEVIRFDQKVLEDRFQLSGRSGLSNEFVGFASGGIEGGGFLYTNLDSVSIGLVLGLKDLREKGGTPYDLLNAFKDHPAIRDMLRDGEEMEYSAHVVSTGDVRGMPNEIYGDGVLVVGEAAGLLLNAGKAIRGMDFAMRSGVVAADTVLAVRREGHDFSADRLAAYREALEESYVLQEMYGFQKAVRLLHQPEMTEMLPNVACDFGRRFFTVESQPSPRAAAMLNASIREHGSYWDLLKLGVCAARAF